MSEFKMGPQPQPPCPHCGEGPFDNLSAWLNHHCPPGTVMNFSRAPSAVQILEPILTGKIEERLPKPCPFCGETQHLRLCRNKGGHSLDIELDTYQAVDGTLSVICKNCGCRGPEVSTVYEAAWDAWNKRTV